MYITLTKKRICLILCGLVLAAILLGQFLSVKAYDVDVSTNAKRVQYIATLGIKLKSDNYTKKDVIIPQEFNEVYRKYNVVQQEANFDLRQYSGKTVSVYTYECDSEKVVNLMVYKGKLIGGDISETRISGRMEPLKGD